MVTRYAVWGRHQPDDMVAEELPVDLQGQGRRSTDETGVQKERVDTSIVIPDVH